MVVIGICLRFRWGWKLLSLAVFVFLPSLMYPTKKAKTASHTEKNLRKLYSAAFLWAADGWILGVLEMGAPLASVQGPKAPAGGCVLPTPISSPFAPRAEGIFQKKNDFSRFFIAPQLRKLDFRSLRSVH